MVHTVSITYDFDAVSAWISYEMPQFVSWGVYGAETCAPRLIELHDRTGVPATWFIPGHTIESFPNVCSSIHDLGHEIQHHGWSHDPLPSFESREREREDFLKGIEAIKGLTGQRPIGFRNPSGGFSEHTIDLLQDLNFEWDSSGKVHDFTPYYLREEGTIEPGKPYVRGEKTNIVEVPIIWHRDDWLQLFPVASGPNYVSYGYESEVFDRWRTELAWMRNHIEDGVQVLLFHPQCAGRAPFLAELERFIQEVKEFPDTEFTDISTVVEEFEAEYR